MVELKPNAQSEPEKCKVEKSPLGKVPVSGKMPLLKFPELLILLNAKVLFKSPLFFWYYIKTCR